MRTVTSRSRRPVHLTVRQTAWLLAVPEAAVYRAIRTGVLRTTAYRGRRVILSTALTPLLGPPVSDGPSAEHEDGDRR